MVKVIFTKTHCIALCDLGHMIQGESLKEWQNMRFYDMVLDNQAGRHTKLDDLREKCDGFGHTPPLLSQKDCHEVDSPSDWNMGAETQREADIKFYKER